MGKIRESYLLFENHKKKHSLNQVFDRSRRESITIIAFYYKLFVQYLLDLTSTVKLRINILSVRVYFTPDPARWTKMYLIRRLSTSIRILRIYKMK